MKTYNVKQNDEYGNPKTFGESVYVLVYGNKVGIDTYSVSEEDEKPNLQIGNEDMLNKDLGKPEMNQQQY